MLLSVGLGELAEDGWLAGDVDVADAGWEHRRKSAAPLFSPLSHEPQARL